MNTLRYVGFVEVGPRDGLQNESRLFSTDEKVEFIKRALRAGAKRIEVASFVNPQRVPQMADAEAVAAALPARDDVSYIGLVLNRRGAERALKTGVHELGAACMASDSFGKRNQGQTSRESLAVAGDIVRMARADGRKGQITISVAFGCPFEGRIAPEHVVALAREAAECEPIEIALADTIGVAAPGPVTELVARVKEAIHPLPVRAHFHNTRNTGLANVWAAVQAGATVVDASLGGLGGCPFAPRATGNVPSEDVAYLLHNSGIDTGLDLAALVDATAWLEQLVGRPLPGMLARAGLFPPAQSL